VPRISATEYLIASAHPIFPTITNDMTTLELLKPYGLPAKIVADASNTAPKVQLVVMTIQLQPCPYFF